MPRLFTLLRRASVLSVVSASTALAQSPRPPALSEFMMPRDAELALASTAAPAGVTGHATLKVLTASGYQVAREGQNGFVCVVMRGWSAPTYTPAPFRGLVYDATVRAPICFDAVAVRTVLPYYEMRSRLGMEGQSPDQIAVAIEAAYARGTLPRREGVSFAYMWSAEQHLGPGVGHWHPHMMVFSPYYENATVGNNPMGPTALPMVTDDGGTPFAVVVIPVADSLAVRMASVK
ncbi:MAG: hypothetical protein ABI679_16575 [Gemmatimonadota bacterium]